MFLKNTNPKHQWFNAYNSVFKMTYHLTLDRNKLFEILINYKRAKLMNSNHPHQNQTRLKVPLAAGVERVIADGLGV